MILLLVIGLCLLSICNLICCWLNSGSLLLCCFIIVCVIIC